MKNFTLKSIQLLTVLFVSASLSLSAQTSVSVSATGNSTFEPSQVSISVGDTVHWFNTGGFHNVNGTLSANPDNPDGFGNALGTGWTYSYVFTIPGTYTYICDAHVGSGMTGVVTVEDVTTSIDVPDSDLVSSVFPVPANEFVVLQLGEGALAKHPQMQLIVYDQLGREKKQRLLGQSDRHEINVSDLHSGLYLFQLIDNNEVLHTGKIVVR